MSRLVWFRLNATEFFAKGVVGNSIVYLPIAGCSNLIRTSVTDAKLFTMIGFPFTRFLVVLGGINELVLRAFGSPKSKLSEFPGNFKVKPPLQCPLLISAVTIYLQ